MRTAGIALAATLLLTPLGVRAADLVVWWEQGFNPEEDAAVREIVAAFEQESGKLVALTQYSNPEMPEKVEAALEAGQPPDFAFGMRILGNISEWALHDKLADLTDTVGSFSNLFDPDALAWFVLLNEKAKQKALYALPMGRTSDHVHVWKAY
jgi:multiple sugar transport system substrate-binding protein